MLDKRNQCDRIKVTQAPVLLLRLTAVTSVAPRASACRRASRMSWALTNNPRVKANLVAASRSGTVRGGDLVTQPERLGAITIAWTLIHYRYWVQSRAGRLRHGIRSADTVANAAHLAPRRNETPASVACWHARRGRRDSGFCLGLLMLLTRHQLAEDLIKRRAILAARGNLDALAP